MSKRRNQKPARAALPRASDNASSGHKTGHGKLFGKSPERQMKKERGHAPSPGGSYWIYGRHAVFAAVGNPDRKILRLVATGGQAGALDEQLRRGSHKTCPPIELSHGSELDKLLPPDSVHQGLAAHVNPLPDCDLVETCRPGTGSGPNLVLVLDQVTDPHNVGAIIRSAAAFGAIALVTTDRHAPPETGALAKSASGTLEILPWVRVTNLARALDDLAELGYWRLGLDGEADTPVDQVDMGSNIVLVLGAEGAGLRKGTLEHCDLGVRLPISNQVESLNVSNAAAVALYALSRPAG